MAEAMDDWAGLHAPAERIRTAKLVNPDPDFLPFLIWEYGLGELTPYVPNLYSLVNEGVRWQRLRGTHRAVAIALGWLAHSAEIREALSHRRFWNSFQLYLDHLPEADAPDLERIENVAALSVPLRSKFRRGVQGYDIPALIGDRSRLDGALLDTDSGVALRADALAPRWSFGRLHEIDHLYSEADGTALDHWLDPVEEGAPLTWADAQMSWSQANFSWVSSAVSARAASLAGFFAGKRLHLALKDVAGEIIGYRLCRAVQVVTQTAGGIYRALGSRFLPATGGTLVYVEAMTAAGDGAGRHVASVALVADAVLADDVPPGRLWLEPQEVSAATFFAETPLAIDLRRTVRERVKIIVRF